VWVGGRRLLVNGQKTDHLRNTRFEVTRTRKLLATVVGSDVPVRGVIVVVGAKDIHIREQPEDVAVLEAARLVRWLNKQMPVLDAPQLAALTSVIRDSSTWSNEVSQIPDTTQFDALDREVGNARRTRMTWGMAILFAVLGVTAPVAFDFYGRVFGN